MSRIMCSCSYTHITLSVKLVILSTVCTLVTTLGFCMITFVPSRYRILPVRSYSHSLPSRASAVLLVLYPLLSLRWVALYARERSRASAHAHGVAHLVESYRPRGISNTQTVLSLTLNARRPRLRRGLLQQRRVALGCLKRRVF